MARSNAVVAFVALAALASSGCGRLMGSGGAGADAARVVDEFLEAVRTGDDQRAAALLTPLARQRTAEMQMVVAPPGSDTAKFEVCEVRLVDFGAEVATNWTDLDTDGRRHTDRILWRLRKEPDGWRIAGMASQVFPGEPEIVLNFEDPAEMLRKQQQAEEEIARRDRQR